MSVVNYQAGYAVQQLFLSLQLRQRADDRKKGSDVMAERDLLVGALIQELLGPRGGPRETLPPEEDPRDEYVTGVLAPHTAVSDEPDSGTELVGEVDVNADDQDDPGEDIYAPTANQAALP